MRNSAINDPELEKEMHRLIPNQSVKAIPMEGMSRYAVQPSENKETLREEMIEKLDRYGLPAGYIQVLVLRFVNNWSFRDIATQLKLQHKAEAHRLFKRALGMLKSRGYR